MSATRTGLLQTPEDLLEWIASHPGNASLAVLAAGDEPLLLDADAPRLLGRTLDAVLLAECARQSAEGTLDGLERVPVAEVAALALVAPPRCLHALEERGQIEAGTVALRALAPFTLTLTDASARDWLLLRLGRGAVEAATLRLGLPREASPRPSAGETIMFVLGSAASAAEVADEAWRLADRLRRDPGSLASERHVASTNALGPREAKDFERRTGPRASTFALARALATLAAQDAALGPGPFFEQVDSVRALEGCFASGLAAAAFCPGGSAVICIEETSQEAWLAVMNSAAHLELARRLASGGPLLQRARAQVSAAVPPSELPTLAAEWRRQIAAPLPANIGPLGMLVAMASGGALLALWHFSMLALPLGITLAILLLAGLTVSMFGGSGGRNALRARVDGALAVLAGSADGPSRRVASVALLANLRDDRGPASSIIYEVSELEARLGPALETVKGVERALREELHVPPIFTARR